MLCYADTIVRIKYTHQTEKQDTKLLIVWDIAIFEKDGFYSVNGKIVPEYYRGNKRPKMTVATSTGVTILNKVINSNKCLLKISLVGIPQESPHIVEVDENAVINILISDYAGQDYNFIVKVMEVIDNKFYIYFKDINYIDAHFFSKQNVLDDSSFHEVVNIARSKLLSTYQNITESTKKIPESKMLSLMGQNDFIDKQSSLASDNISSKCTCTECTDEFTDLFNDTDNNDLHLNRSSDINISHGDEIEKLSKNKKQCKGFVYSEKGKKPVGRSLRSALRLYNFTIDTTNNE
ncbi:15428_t:CDS:2, partial [Cetraspora pellucida]